MSASVNYKGQTITEIDNETKVLNTAGTWLEDDITITEESSGGGSVWQDEDGYIHLSATIEDGKTRIYLEMPEERRSPYLALCPNGTVTVDWGDGSATDTLTGSSLTSLKYVQHTYPSAGSYVMTLTATDGEFAFYGTSIVPSFLRYDNGTSNSSGYRSGAYLNTIQKIELGDGVCIGQCAFQNCYSLTSITIPDGVTSIGSNAFQNCHSLTSITIPDGVTSIVDYAFSGCYSLASITIPDGVTSIGSNAFQNCHSLTSITIPDGVTSIGNYAFQGCSSLASITIPDGVTNIGNYAFRDCPSLASITIPDGVTSIGDYAFSGCSSLASITIPDGVTSIGQCAFQNCHSLASITIPDGVTSIAGGMFDSCYSLASITIPDGVTSIGNSAFYYCYFLAEIHFKPTTPPTVANSNAWTSLNTDCVIFVPTGTLEAYTTVTNYPSSSTYTYMEESA